MFVTAREMSKALTMATASLGGPAGLSEIAEVIDNMFADDLQERREFLQRVSSNAHTRPSLPTVPRDTSMSYALALQGLDEEETDVPTEVTPYSQPERNALIETLGRGRARRRLRS